MEVEHPLLPNVMETTPTRNEELFYGNCLSLMPTTRLAAWNFPAGETQTTFSRFKLHFSPKSPTLALRYYWIFLYIPGCRFKY